MKQKRQVSRNFFQRCGNLSADIMSCPVMNMIIKHKNHPTINTPRKIITWRLKFSNVSFEDTAKEIKKLNAS